MIKIRLATFLVLAFGCLLQTNSFAIEDKPITSWKDIVIGKTTEAEIAAGKRGGTVNLSVTNFLKLTKGESIIRVLKYGSERSYAAETRKKNERDIWAAKEGVSEAFKFLYPQSEFELNLEHCLKPAILRNGPVDLRWDKLECAKFEVYSNGIVQGWVMKYWFLDPYDNYETLSKRKAYIPSKEEVLEMFEVALGKPTKILKPKPDTDVYEYLIGSRKLELRLYYAGIGTKIGYVEFKEGDIRTELMKLLGSFTKEI